MRPEAIHLVVDRALDPADRAAEAGGAAAAEQIGLGAIGLAREARHMAVEEKRFLPDAGRHLGIEAQIVDPAHRQHRRVEPPKEDRVEQQIVFEDQQQVRIAVEEEVAPQRPMTGKAAELARGQDAAARDPGTGRVIGQFGRRGAPGVEKAPIEAGGVQLLGHARAAIGAVGETDDSHHHARGAISGGRHRSLPWPPK
jgi:hypothetical protein